VNDTGFSNKVRGYFRDQSDIRIYATSVVISGWCAYRYLSNKYVMMEYHGHFNSPQNMLNKRLTSHYLKDAAARFFIGFGLLTALQMGTKYYLGGYDSEANLVDKMESPHDDVEEYTNQAIKEGDINEALKRRENVNKYLKK
jgi:hypothetical protein